MRGIQRRFSVALLCAVLCGLATPALANDGDTYAACFQEVGRYDHINPLLLRAIAKQESNFNPRAMHHNRNGSWDIGIMQINTFWVPTIERAGVDPNRLLTDPCLNIAVGGAILHQNIQRYGMSWRAVGAYNAVTPWKRDRYAAAIAKRLEAELRQREQ